jgi:hypothetical protein
MVELAKPVLPSCRVDPRGGEAACLALVEALVEQCKRLFRMEENY